jgi:hypothetical protein
MKTPTPILILGLIVASFIGGLFFGRIRSTTTPQQLTLEQILSIRELHLVKHSYNDLFFLHRNNNPEKPIRAMVQVPVTITAYLNLKDIELVYQGDSIQKVILPRAILNEPVYHLDKSTIRETRGFQLHAGKDLYPTVGTYMGQLIRVRMDSARNLAVANRILIQAEAEGKEYIESLLHTFGHKAVMVTFDNEAKDKEVNEYIKALHKDEWTPLIRPSYTTHVEVIPFGFIPMPK